MAVTDPPPAIRLLDLTVDFPGFALGPVSMSIARGERVALVGENGAGKSTLLRAISGMHNVHRGRVEVEGRAVGEASAQVRARVGHLPERLLGFGWMTVAEHLRFLSHFHPTWDSGYAEELRVRLGLPEDTKIANLSKGMQVKLSFLAAEAFRPPILLLDEPTSGVDPVMRREMVELVRGTVPKDGDRAMVFSTHILEDVEAVAERVLLLRAGRLIGDTSVEALRAHGASGSVAGALYGSLTARG